MSLRKNAPSTRLIPIFSMFLGLGILLYALAALVTPAQAAPAFQEDKPTNDFCLACHQEEGIDKTLGKESLPVTINPTQFKTSVHAEEGFNCVDCHTNISDYPHPDVKVKNVRDFTLTFTETCKDATKNNTSMHMTASIRKHWMKVTKTQPSVWTATILIHRHASQAKAAEN